MLRGAVESTAWAGLRLSFPLRQNAARKTEFESLHDRRLL